MDDKVYTQASDIKKKIASLNMQRAAVLSDFDYLGNRAANITDIEFVNMLASMRSTLDQYFDKQVAPLNKQFGAL